MNHAATGLLKLHGSVRQGEQRPVATNAHVLARVELGTALPDDDAARGDEFGTESLDAQTFRLAVAAVLCAALSLFMCHEKCSFEKWVVGLALAGDFLDLHNGQFCAKTLLFVEALAALHLERDELFAPLVLDDVGGDFGTSHGRSA